MRYEFWVDAKPISQAQAIKLSKIENICTATVRREAAFTDMMHSLLSNGRLFEEDYDSRFVYVLKMDIVGDTVSSIFSAASCRTTCVCYIRVGKMKNK